MGGDSHDHRSNRMGSQRELINIRGAHLYLIDGKESVLMTGGEFSLKLLKQTHSPLAVVVANVGDVQWPVGKDAPVLKLWNRRYTFALPGLVYGMILPDTTPIGVLQQLESILSEYSTFELHHEIVNAGQFGMNGRRDDSGFWTSVAPDVETLSSRVARNIDSASIVVANSIEQWVKQGMMKRKDPDADDGGGMSPRMIKRMQQARRMSAVAKLMSRSLLKGAISAQGHVSKTMPTAFDTHTPGPIYSLPDPNSPAVATVDAFGKVVEAVETAGKSLLDATQRQHESVGQVFHDVANTAWTLNKMGVRMLLRMTAASAALNSRTSSSTCSSVTSDDQSFSSTGTMRSMKQSRSAPELQHQPSLQTSQLFPTSAEQMRTRSYIHPVIPPRATNSPFQQYHQSSFSFHPQANLQME